MAKFVARRDLLWDQYSVALPLPKRLLIPVNHRPTSFLISPSKAKFTALANVNALYLDITNCKLLIERYLKRVFDVDDDLIVEWGLLSKVRMSVFELV